MKRFFGRRGLSAAMGIFMLAASNPAQAEPAAASVTTHMAAAAPAAVRAVGPATVYLANGQAVQATAAAVAATSTPATVIAQAPLMLSSTLPLTALVAGYIAGAPLDEQANCLATAVYFEARGESLEGQLAVANVVINRARSNKYPPTWCEVVKQPWQFSFVRNGRFPRVDYSSAAWARAQAIARIAGQDVAAEVEPDVLWYHADYVAPSWGRRLKRAEKIGTHIFYRA